MSDSETALNLQAFSKEDFKQKLMAIKIRPQGDGSEYSWRSKAYKNNLAKKVKCCLDSLQLE